MPESATARGLSVDLERLTGKEPVAVSAGSLTSWRLRQTSRMTSKTAVLVIVGPPGRGFVATKSNWA